MSYRYFNKNTGQVASFENPSTRLEYLQNWVTVESDEQLVELQEGKQVRAPGLLGSSKVAEPDPPHPPPTPEPEGIRVGEPPPPTEPPAPEPEPDPPLTKEPNPADRPSKAAAKDKWIDWAVKCGTSREEAVSLTKQDLIDIYGE